MSEMLVQQVQPGPGAASGTTADGRSAPADAPSGVEAAQLAEQLSDRDREILAFERQWWKYAGAKEQAIRDQFGVSPTRYYQILNKLIDKQEAMHADPMLVKRLRKVRASRRRARVARRLGIELP